MSRTVLLSRARCIHWYSNTLHIGKARNDLRSTPPIASTIAHVVPDSSRKDFDLATLRFIARLRNGHTQFFDNSLDGRPLKFRLLEVEDKWVVINSQDSRLPSGSVVRSLNGTPIEDFVREMSQYVAASNDRIARTQLFSYAGLFPDKNSVGLENGDVVVIDRGGPADVRQQVPIQASQGRWLRDARVAYIQVPTFGDPAFEQTAIELVRQYSASRV